jgi:methylenetetrahydrofolate dehydrogenase (NADP+)/methenyltetrahydrofolate cyclohydrolase
MILNGKIVADTIKQQLKEEIDNAVASGRRRPRLVIISVGDDPASKVYVRNKMRAAEECGIDALHKQFGAEAFCLTVCRYISALNLAEDVDGIMVQLPLPSHLDERAIIDTIDPAKDVDGLTTTNIGRLRSGQPCIKPCTAAGIIDLLDYYNIELDHQDVTIIGRSNIVGKPLADMMMERGATVTQCHSHTRSLEDALEFADIVVSAVGKPKFLDHKPLSFWTGTIIDVGINRDENGKLCGDVDYDDIIEHRMDTINITPVPGGVGPMTVAELMKNTVECWKNNIR